MEIKVYSTTNCPYCKFAKEHLASKGLAYDDVDVAADPVALDEMVKLSGQMGVPVVVIGSEVIVGFDKERIDALVT